MKNRRILSIAAIAFILVAVVISLSKNSDDAIVVTIKGNTKNVTYNGKLQSAIGYTVKINSDKYTTEDFVCYATDSVSAVNAGTYSMGIESSDFCNVNPNYDNVVFEVIDGCLSINEANDNSVLASRK